MRLGWKIYLGILFVIVLFSVAFFANSPGTPEPIAQRGRVIDEKVASDALPRESAKYFLKLEDGRLCAYEEKNGERTLIKESEAEPLYITRDEEERLKNGIYAEHKEELLLYFESYLS